MREGGVTEVEAFQACVEECILNAVRQDLDLVQIQYLVLNYKATYN